MRINFPTVGRDIYVPTIGAGDAKYFIGGLAKVLEITMPCPIIGSNPS